MLASWTAIHAVKQQHEKVQKVTIPGLSKRYCSSQCGVHGHVHCVALKLRRYGHSILTAVVLYLSLIAIELGYEHHS
jgi:hypothetical protein